MVPTNVECRHRSAFRAGDGAIGTGRRMRNIRNRPSRGDGVDDDRQFPVAVFGRDVSIRRLGHRAGDHGNVDHHGGADDSGRSVADGLLGERY